ncbi:carbohydrate ABC transporter permease [Paenibacillus oryzisoli]|uniref:carbohydrate ABC transporter permease n=1 Tax=Paenibacillus oryzisoli TaxID=1850517 RepID=UPI003D287BA1
MTVYRKSIAEHIFDGGNAILLLFLGAATLYPIIHVIAASLSNADQLMSHQGPLLFPLGLQWEAYRLVLNNPNIGTGFRNTLFIVVFGTILNVFMTAMGAYVLSRKQVYWNKILMLLIVFTMYFSGGLIPTYLLVYKTLHLKNSLFALIIPGMISTWNLIIMRTSFKQIPDSLLESAKIDGANDFGLLFRIVIPLSMPILSVMILFYGVGHWNAWFNAMLYLRERQLFPLQLILREILIQNNTDSMMTGVGSLDKQSVSESIKYATIVVATFPILVIYPFLQRYFVKGVMIGALKE